MTDTLPDQSVLDLPRHSTAGTTLDRPVANVLREMGLPALPTLPPAPPLPGLPPLPVLDLHLLTKPITDLAGAFGSGRLGAGSGPDAAETFSQIAYGLTTVVELGTAAVQLAMPLWRGAGATAAVSRTAHVGENGAELAAQDRRAQRRPGLRQG